MDDHIILMLADDIACNSRNPHAPHVYYSVDHKCNLYGDEIQVDYRGSEVTVASLLNLLTGRHLPSTPKSKRLLSSKNSNVLLYMTGHGGDEFLKFHDSEEVQTQDLAQAFHEMYIKERYRNLLFIVDTCQAATLYSKLFSPNILALSSSLKGENSYSYKTDETIGVSLVDRFTYFNFLFLKNVEKNSSATLKDMFDSLKKEDLLSTPHFREDLSSKSLAEIQVVEFFGSPHLGKHFKHSYPNFVGSVNKGGEIGS